MLNKRYWVFSSWLNTRRLILGLVSVLIALLAVGLSQIRSTGSPSTTYTWNLPANLPRPVIPADNPMTPAKVELGRYLFYEKQLSVTGQQACASCHLQRRAFSDGRSFGIGATGERHPRNSMSLTNVGYNSVLTWANPGMTRLETQALVPLFGEHPVEMGMSGKEEQILTFLSSSETYQQLFAAAFGSGADTISINNLIKALACFERSLVSFNSPYDRYRFLGERQAISAAAQRGERLFNSERLECFHCHGGLNFSDSIQHERLAFTEVSFHNTGLYNIGNTGNYPANNQGIYEFTRQPKDMGRFKATTLRNIALTAPYMHDGSMGTLEQVIEHYRVGGRTLSVGAHAGAGHRNPYKSQFVSGFTITPQEKSDLLAFLNSLTDLSFVTNPELGPPTP